MRFKKTALIVALCASMGMSAQAQMDVSNSASFQTSYGVVSKLVQDLYQQSGYKTQSHTIKDLKTDGDSSSFNEILHLSMAVPKGLNGEDFSINIEGNSQRNAKHSPTETQLSGPVVLKFSDTKGISFELNAENTSSLDQKGTLTDKVQIKNISKVVGNISSFYSDGFNLKQGDAVTVDEVSILSKLSLDAQATKLAAIQSTFDLTNFLIARKNGTTESSFGLKKVTSNYDMTTTDLKGIFLGKMMADVSGFSIVTPDSKVRAVNINNLKMIADLTQNNELYNVSFGFDLDEIQLVGQDNTNAKWGKSSISVAINGLDAKGYSEYQSKLLTVKDDKEIIELMKNILRADLEIAITIKSQLNDKEAVVSFAIKSTQALVDAVKASQMPSINKDNIHEYVSMAKLSVSFPKAYFVDNALNVNSLMGDYKDSKLTADTLGQQFSQGIAMSAMFIPQAFQPVVKFENETASFDISYANSVLRINDKQLTLDEVHAALKK